MILVLIALGFAATLIALSVNKNPIVEEGDDEWGDSKRIERTFSVQPDGKLVLDTDEGNVTMIGSDSNELRVVVLASGSSDRLKKFKLDFHQDDNTVNVIGRRKAKFRFFDIHYFDIRFEIQLPKHFNIELQTAGGNIVARNVEGNFHGKTSGGEVDLEELDGEIDVTTSGGNIQIRHSKGTFTLYTSGGDIVGKSVVGPMNVETSGGNILLSETDGQITASTSGGNIKVEANDNKGIDLSTSGGNIRITLPKSISANVDAKAFGGEVSCEFELAGTIKEGKMKGKINGGGNPIKAETSGGNIALNVVE